MPSLVIDRFQSTRPSRASTYKMLLKYFIQNISIHKALAGLDPIAFFVSVFPCLFQSTRPSRASTVMAVNLSTQKRFQSTRPSRASTPGLWCHSGNAGISIHKALAGLDALCNSCVKKYAYFNPQGPRGPRRIHICCNPMMMCHFNPQGPRGPRRVYFPALLSISVFQSTRPSRASTFHLRGYH